MDINRQDEQKLCFSELINGCEKRGQRVFARVADNWMQGRTTYGGLSAALCLKAVYLTNDDLPPLRSALISFVGPVGGEIQMTTTVLRRGKSVSTIRVDMLNDDGFATQAVFSFGRQRQSRLNTVFQEPANVPDFEQSIDFFGDINQAPVFARNFDVKLAKGGHPISGSKHHEHFIWARHKDPNAQDLIALVGLADMPPPAVLPMFNEFAPISSMTWQINLTDTTIESKDGWWLLRTAAEHAKDGYSSQDMQIWNTDGELVMTGRQNVAIFY